MWRVPPLAFPGTHSTDNFFVHATYSTVRSDSSRHARAYPKQNATATLQAPRATLGCLHSALGVPVVQLAAVHAGRAASGAGPVVPAALFIYGRAAVLDKLTLEGQSRVQGRGREGVFVFVLILFWGGKGRNCILHASYPLDH